MSDLTAIEREITEGLARMRDEVGIKQPHRFDPVACMIGVFAVACVCLGLFAGAIR